MVAVSGTGLDFGVSISPATTSVNAGQTATMQATVTALGGAFPNAVSLTCAITPAAANAPPTCNVSPSQLTPSTNGSGLTLTFNSTAPMTTLLLPLGAQGGMLAALLVPITAVLAGTSSKRLRVKAILGITACTFLLTLVVSCGGSHNTTQHQTIPGTSPGTYTVTVTSTSGSLTHAASAMVTVQ